MESRHIQKKKRSPHLKLSSPRTQILNAKSLFLPTLDVNVERKKEKRILILLLFFVRVCVIFEDPERIHTGPLETVTLHPKSFAILFSIGDFIKIDLRHSQEEPTLHMRDVRKRNHFEFRFHSLSLSRSPHGRVLCFSVLLSIFRFCALNSVSLLWEDSLIIQFRWEVLCARTQTLLIAFRNPNKKSERERKNKKSIKGRLFAASFLLF